MYKVKTLDDLKKLDAHEINDFVMDVLYEDFYDKAFDLAMEYITDSIEDTDDVTTVRDICIEIISR